VGTDDGGIDAPQVAVDEALLVQPEQESIEDLGPGAILAPAVEAVVDGLPRPVPFRGVRPGRAGVEMPQDAIDQEPMIFPRASCPTVVIAIGKEGSNLLPLSISKFVAVHGWPPCGYLPARELGTSII